MRWSQDQLNEYLSRSKVSAMGSTSDEIPDDGLENKLQAKCLRYCKEHGYPAFHDWSRRKNPAGWPDLFVFLPNGRVKLFELKSKDGKFRKEQLELRKVLYYLGHTVHLVRSFKTFLMVLNEGKK